MLAAAIFSQCRIALYIAYKILCNISL